MQVMFQHCMSQLLICLVKCPYSLLIFLYFYPLSPFLSLYIGPSIEVTTSLSSLSILDTPPYNNITLTCTTVIPTHILSPLSFTWRVLKIGSQTLPTHLRNGTNGVHIEEITTLNNNINDSIISSSLYSSSSGIRRAPGLYHYICEVVMEIKEDIQPSDRGDIEVIVIGKYLHVYMNMYMYMYS